jgi:hypothetical protein
MAPIVLCQTARLRAHVAARTGGEADWEAPERVAAEAGLVFRAAVGALERAEHSPGERAAAAALAEALPVFERLTAQPFAERARKLLAAVPG